MSEETKLPPPPPENKVPENPSPAPKDVNVVERSLNSSSPPEDCNVIPLSVLKNDRVPFKSNSSSEES